MIPGSPGAQYLRTEGEIERRKLITSAKSDRFLDYLAALPIAVKKIRLEVFKLR